MAILKHISVKNRFYSSAVEYLTCQFDEYTNKHSTGFLCSILYIKHK